MKTIIIDDERLARKELKDLLSDFDDIKLIGESHNAENAKKKIESLRPDLIFLDIQMPGENGFELLENLEFLPKVVFTTAYDEYALKAFEVNALDYLLKPIEKERLKSCLNRILEVDEKEQQSQNQSDSASENHKKPDLGLEDQVFVKDGERCWFVKLKNISLFESEGNYVRIYFEANKPLILKTLNSLEERLDDRFFFRANRKYIINLEWIKNMETWFNGGLRLTLLDGKQIEVSRRQASKLKELKSL